MSILTSVGKYVNFHRKKKNIKCDLACDFTNKKAQNVYISKHNRKCFDTLLTAMKTFKNNSISFYS